MQLRATPDRILHSEPQWNTFCSKRDDQKVNEALQEAFSQAEQFFIMSYDRSMSVLPFHCSPGNEMRR